MSELGLDEAALWLTERRALLVVWAEGLAPEVARLAASTSTGAAPQLSIPDVPESASALAAQVSRVLQLHPQAGAVSLVADGALADAGAHPLVELVGSMTRHRCSVCGHAPLPSEPNGANGVCPLCGGAPRPDAVLGDEVLDPRLRLQAEYLAARADGIVLLGATVVSSALRNLLRSPLAAGAELLVVGDVSEDEELTDARRLPGPIETAWPALVERYDEL